MYLDSEYHTLLDVALCAPDFYAWAPANAIVIESMARGFRPDVAAAQHQHAGMTALLASRGVRCHFITPDPHLGYQTFVRDVAVMTPWGLLIACAARPERSAEWTGVLELAQRLALPVWKTVTAGSMEGGDVQILRSGLVVIGLSAIRTSRAGADQVAGWFQDEGWEVKFIRVPAHFLHLDLLFSTASHDLALCATECLDREDVAWLKAQGFRLIEVGYRDTMRVGCNVTALGGGVVLSSAQHEPINQRLRAEGLTVLAPDLEQFILEGGGSHCLTLPLRREVNEKQNRSGCDRPPGSPLARPRHLSP